MPVQFRLHFIQHCISDGAYHDTPGSAMRHVDELAMMAASIRRVAAAAREDGPSMGGVVWRGLGDFPPCWCGKPHLEIGEARAAYVVGKWTCRGWADWGSSPLYAWLYPSAVDTFEEVLADEAPDLLAELVSDVMVARRYLRQRWAGSFVDVLAGVSGLESR